MSKVEPRSSNIGLAKGHHCLRKCLGQINPRLSSPRSLGKIRLPHRPQILPRPGSDLSHVGSLLLGSRDCNIIVVFITTNISVVSVPKIPRFFRIASVRVHSSVGHLASVAFSSVALRRAVAMACMRSFSSHFCLRRFFFGSV